MKVEIVAEIGKNFIVDEEPATIQANITKAKRLIIEAQKSGADTVKFQAHTFKDEHKKRSMERWAWIKRNEKATPEVFWSAIAGYCKEKRIGFLVTPMSKLAAMKVNPFVERFKIGSADIVDEELLKYVYSTRKPVILSTGMSKMLHITKALRSAHNKVTLMHCVSMYPTPDLKVNLNTIPYLREQFKIPVGYSDHSLSLDIPALAVAMGVPIIEKHFTLNRDGFGPDHKISLRPIEFKEMVANIRRVELIMGKEEKYLNIEEKRLWKKFRVS